MRIKYFVYYKGPERIPTAELWISADGSLTHPKYWKEHNIDPKTLSSVGEVFSRPNNKSYFNHTQSLEGYDPYSYADNLLKERRANVIWH